MSINTLKKKTAAKYNNNSVGYSQFSLQGTHRNHGYVGQDMNGRTILKTPFRGNTPRGSGGCCGNYTQSIVTPYGTCSVEDSKMVKSSVLSNRGFIQTHYRWIRRPAPITTVKPDDNLKLNSSQSSHITLLKNRVINSINIYNETNSTIPPIRIVPRFNFKVPCPTTTKFVGTLNQSTYLLNVNQACTANDAKIPLASPNTPLPGN
jgi:hypothetical protein